MTLNAKDILAGAIFIALGLIFGFYAYADLPFGSPRSMGPGFFPIMLAGILVVIGIAVALMAINKPSSPMMRIPWRGLVLILLSPIVFGLSVRSLGFIPAVLLVAAISSFASARMKLWMAVAIVVGITVFCVTVFYYGLGLPVRLFGPVFAG